MDNPGWLSRHAAEVPPGEEWLGARERTVLAELRVAPRRESWRLGRFTAKSALAAWLSVAPHRLEVLAASDGAPEAWLDGLRAPVSLSLSHRGDCAIAMVSAAPALAGCDLEVIERRSDAFVREWLAPGEQELVFARAGAERALLANLIWTAKEAAAKVRRAGLRLDVRRAVVVLEEPSVGRWGALRVQWSGATETTGWWRAEQGWVMSLATSPASGIPQRLSGSDRAPI